MKSRPVIAATFGIALLYGATPLFSQGYDPGPAVSYADRWCGNDTGCGQYPYHNTSSVYDPTYGTTFHDPTYYNTYGLDPGDGVGDDCANFVSQALIAGGLDAEIKSFLSTWSSSDRVNYAGRQFTPANPDTGPLNPPMPGIGSGGVFGTVANATLIKLKDFLNNSFHAEYTKGKIPDNLGMGDVVLVACDACSGVGPLHHSMLVTEGLGVNAKVSYHSRDTFHQPLGEFFSDYPESLAFSHFFHLTRTVPFVKSRMILQGTNTIYQSQWGEAVGGRRDFNLLANASAVSNQDLSITLDFNESMKWVGVSATGPGGGAAVHVAGNFTDVTQTRWQGILTAAQVTQNNLIGTVTLSIEGFNFASSSYRLDSFPGTIAAWNGSGFSGYEDEFGNDTGGGKDILTININSCGTPNSLQEGGSNMAVLDSAEGSCSLPPLSVDVSPQSQTGSDNTSVSYSLTITNNDTNSANFALQSEAPPGWATSFNPAMISLAPGGSAGSQLTVSVPLGESPQPYDVIIHAMETTDSVTYTVNAQSFPTLRFDPATQNGTSPGTVNYTVYIKNNNATFGTFSLIATSPSPSWTVSIPPTISLGAGQEGSVNMSVSAPSSLTDGSSYSIMVTATESTNPSNRGSANAIYNIGAPAGSCPSTADPILSLYPTGASPDIYAVSGPTAQTVEYTLTVINNDPSGCRNTTFNLSAQTTPQPPAGWSVTFDPPSLTLQPQQSMNSTVRVTVPANTPANTFTINNLATDSLDSLHQSAPLSAHIIVQDATTFTMFSNKDGNWEDPTIWGGRVPSITNPVLVTHHVTINGEASAKSVWVANDFYPTGTLSFSRSNAGHLTIGEGDFAVNRGGWLDMGTEDLPIPQGIKAEIQFNPTMQHKMLVADGGKLTLWGASKTGWTDATEDALIGASFIRVAGSPVGWSVDDEITIDTERRTIASISGSNPTTIGLSGSLSSNHYIRDRIRVANLTRNVRIGSNPNKIYIHNHSANPGDFSVNSAELYKLGVDPDPGSSQDEISGLFFANQDPPVLTPRPPAQGTVSNSVLKDGLYKTYAAYLIDTSSSAFLNNVIFNNGGGIAMFGSQRNQILSNYIFGNINSGITESGSPNNTFAFNILYANAHGISLGWESNTVLSNIATRNSLNGLDIQRPSNTVVDNYSFGNGTDFRGQGEVIGGALGYDEQGGPYPATTQEIVNVSGYAFLPLILRHAHLNPTTHRETNPNSGILSYNQDQDMGTVRLWGQYTVPGSTLSLDYSAPLFMSAATIPILMKGIGHAASVVSTNNDMAVTQLVSIRYESGLWRVEGSKTRVLGNFSGSITNQPFPSDSPPQFNLTFVQGGSPQEGDLIHFVLIAGSKDENRQKKLLVGPSSPSVNGGRSKLTIDPNGEFRMVGSTSLPSIMDRIDGSSPYYTFVNSGAITLSYAQINNTDEKGLQISGSGVVSVDHATFDFAGQDGSGVSSYITARDLTSQATLKAIQFNNSRPNTTLYNIQVLGNDSGLDWTIRGYGGPKAGPQFSYPPNTSKIKWDPTVESAHSGLWSDPGTWLGGLVPDGLRPVQVSAGHVVTVNNTQASAGPVNIYGTLSFSRTVSSQLTLTGGDIVVHPGGHLDIGKQDSSIPGSVKATLVLALGSYAGQYGLKVLNGGRFTVRGALKYASGRVVSNDAPAGTTSITVDLGWTPNRTARPWAVGDEITIGPASQDSMFQDEVERRIITAVSGFNPVTITFSPALNYAHTLNTTLCAQFCDYVYTIPTPVVVTNLTRNVLVRSQGTNIFTNTAYIENQSQDPNGFWVYDGEFAYLGRGIKMNSNPDFYLGGITFHNAARGTMAHSTIRDGYHGILSYDDPGGPSENALSFHSNLIGFNYYGATLMGSSGNTLQGNHIFSNISYGVSLEDSSKNTLSKNEIYSNGNRFDNSNGVNLRLPWYDVGHAKISRENTLVENRIFSNRGSGIEVNLQTPDRNPLDSNSLVSNKIYMNGEQGLFVNTSYGNLYLKNYSYANNYYNARIIGSGQDTFTGETWGFDDLGNSTPGSGLYMENANLTTFKEIKINRGDGGMDDLSQLQLNKAVSLLSYNQNYDTGTIRLWGNYTVSAGSILTLSHMSLYSSEATNFKLMRGVGHSATVNGYYGGVISQLITIYRQQSSSGSGRWVVMGSSSGLMGFFTGSINGQMFPASDPQISLTFTEGPAPQGMDSLDFVLVAGSNDFNVPKKLLFGASYDPSTGQTVPSKLTIAPNGAFNLSSGLYIDRAIMDTLSPDVPNYTFINNGDLTLSRAQINNADEKGLQLSGGGQINMNFTTFDYSGAPLNPGASNVSTYITARDLTSQTTFDGLTFNNSGAPAGAILCNVRVLGDDSGLSWTMTNHSGPRSGEAYNDDLHNKVIWATPSPTPPAAAQPVDTMPPTVSIINPANGDAVSGESVQISAQSSDDTGVVGVQFKLDGNNLGVEVTTAPFSILWNTTSTANGSHVITATARDAAGNIATSSPIQVTVENIVLKKPKLGSVNLMRSDGSVIALDGPGSPRALMISQRNGMNQQLEFGPEVVKASIVDLRGREIFQAESQAGNPIIFTLQQAGGRLLCESGLLLIQIQTQDLATQQRRKLVKPLVCAK
ncbi:MAG: right-handed parallel beta-helix repeat-containing protein [Elusimicrobia bacterium]|nr:right-handed parallel beta-helix repeat-containing protein [Elusimicrobiota bacterium]